MEAGCPVSSRLELECHLFVLVAPQADLPAAGSLSFGRVELTELELSTDLPESRFATLEIVSARISLISVMSSLVLNSSVLKL